MTLFRDLKCLNLYENSLEKFEALLRISSTSSCVLQSHISEQIQNDGVPTL